MDTREFTEFGELDKLSDEDLEKKVVVGINIHIPTSEASVAKRILDNRRQRKQVEAAKNVEKVTNQIEKSHKELVTIVAGMTEVIAILTFLKSHWFPRKPLWIKIGAFLILTVGSGIMLNIIADWIVKFILHW